MKRDYQLLTKSELTKYIQLSPQLQSIFQSQDPNFIANTITNEMKNIIISIAPAKKVQIKKPPTFSYRRFTARTSFH